MGEGILYGITTGCGSKGSQADIISKNCDILHGS